MRARPALTATLLYGLLAVAMTWPLARGLGRDIPSDLGDSILNCWILDWDLRHLERLAAGEPRAFEGFWSPGIYHPEPLALAYSEHLLGLAAQALPVRLLGGGIVLCYDLLFLSTFVLSSLGAFLLTRELTGSVRAAVVAGLLYGFAPYRIEQLPHLQVLSSQWMPFALYALRRYFGTRRPWPLLGAVAAVVAQNLSCGYYLLFFTPFLVLYVACEIAVRGLARDWRLWRDLLLAALAVSAACAPCLLPYLELRELEGGRRGIQEVERFSADLYGYLTAPGPLRLWGGVLEAYRKPEGGLFPGVVPLLLAVVGLRDGLRGPARARPGPLAGFFAVAALLAFALSLGPVVAAGGRPLASGPYALVYAHLPGYDGVRVPARFAMLLALFLAILGGVGARAIERRGRSGAVALLVLSACFLAESTAAPLPLNRRFASRHYTTPPLITLAPTPRIYAAVAALPPGAVLAEFPFGVPAFEVRYMFHSLRHGRPLVNGFSGWAPRSYNARRRLLGWPPDDPVSSASALLGSGATHVVVHEWAWRRKGKGREVSLWLERSGARVVAADGADQLYALPRPRP
jgi:hypothetical protein